MARTIIFRENGEIYQDNEGEKPFRQWNMDCPVYTQGYKSLSMPDGWYMKKLNQNIEPLDDYEVPGRAKAYILLAI